MWTGALPTGVTDYYDGLSNEYFLPFAGTSTAATLNLGGKGAKPVYVGNGNGGVTTHYPAYSLIHLTYVVDSRLNSGNGCWKVSAYQNSTYYIDSVYCSTAAATAAKVGSCSNYALQKGHLQVLLMNANTSAGAITLNINGTGAKPIYINGTASSASNYTLPKAMYMVYYDGTNFYFRTDGKITGDITGNAATVNGLTVQTAVPANAEFTDTIYRGGGTNPINVGGATCPVCGSDSSNYVNGKCAVCGYVGKYSHMISHANSGVTAASKGDTANQTPAWGGTFKVPSGTVNATGHLTAFADHTVKIPNAVATQSAAGLMSSTDKQKVDMINSQGTVAYYQKQESSFTTTAASTTTVPIGISGFNTTDMLLVDINGLSLVQGTDYTISGTNITLTTPITSAGAVVHFVALRAVTASATDIATLKGDKGDPGQVQDVLLNGTSIMDATDKKARITTSALINIFYPVGSYYETSDGDFNPNTAWGGTWELEAQGLVHIGAGATYTIGSTGGSATHKHTTQSHKLTAAESGLPAHTHTQAKHRHELNTKWSSGSGSVEAYTMANNRTAGATRYTDYQTPTINENTAKAATSAHSHGDTGETSTMQPYVAVNRWHRTA